MIEPLTIEKLFNENHKKFKLIPINKVAYDKRIITSTKINRPGLELTGFWEYFQKDRIQIFGMKENHYLNTISNEHTYKVFEKLFKKDIPAAVFAHRTLPPEGVVEIADKYKIPLFKTQLLTSTLIGLLMEYLDWNLAPSCLMHGSLVDVYGVGLLITGRSGIGKSEVALDLVERGHRLVADDLVKVIRRADNVIIGMGTSLLEHHIEIRGLGIIDVGTMFGVRGIRKQKRVEVQVELQDWSKLKNYERIGSMEKFTKIIDVKTPIIQLPIFPGKNVTVIAETVALNHMLKMYGHNAAKEFEDKIKNQIQIKTLNYLKKDFE